MVRWELGGRRVLSVHDLKVLVETDWEFNNRAAAHEGKNRWAHPLRLFARSDLSMLHVADIDGYKLKRLAEGASRKSVNNELGLVRRGLNLALEQELVARVPRIKNLRCDNVREGFIDPPEYLRLVELIQRRDVAAADAVRFMYLLGWRREEVLGLTWSEVNPQAGTIRLPARRTKNRAPKVIRVGAEIRGILARRLAWRQGPFVLQRRGEQVRTFRGSWGEARKILGRPALIPHDCRRSFARNALAAGLDVPLIMTIGGWKTMSVFLRYAIVDEARIEYGVERVSAYIAGLRAALQVPGRLPPWLVAALQALTEIQRAEAAQLVGGLGITLDTTRG